MTAPAGTPATSAALPVPPYSTIAAGAAVPGWRVAGLPAQKAAVTGFDIVALDGPRGFAHVGALLALSELNLRPDLVVGASIGSLIGSLYAGEMAPQAIERLAIDFNMMAVVRPYLPPASSGEKLGGQGLVAMVNDLLNRRPLEEMPIPMAVAAMQCGSREVVAFTRGNPGVAVQASCAIEGTLAPVRIRGATYVDPDLGAPMPVRVARALGASRVLAIDVSAHEPAAPPVSEHYRSVDLRKRARTEPNAQAATLTLHPKFSYCVSLSQAFREEAIRAGYEQTLAQRDQLRQLFQGG